MNDWLKERMTEERQDYEWREQRKAGSATEWMYQSFKQWVAQERTSKNSTK